MCTVNYKLTNWLACFALCRWFCTDAYKLVDIRISLYVILIEDGNDQSEIASLGLLVNE